MEWNKEKILVFRKKLGLTRAQFAELLSISRQSVTYWEKGERNPSGISQKALTFLAEKEGIDLEILGKEKMN